MPPMSNQPAPLDPNYYMQPTGSPAPKNSGRKRAIIIGAVILVIMIIVSVGAVIASRGEKKQNATTTKPGAQTVAQEFLGHLTYAREDEAFNMYVPHNQPSKSDMKQFMATVPNMIDPSQCKLDGEETSPELSYTYLCPARAKNEAGMKLKVTLLSVGDGYKIVSCRFVGKA